MKTPRALALALAATLAVPVAAFANTAGNTAGNDVSSDVVQADQKMREGGRGQGKQGGKQGRFAKLPPEERAALRERVKQKIQTYLTVELSSRAGLDDKKSLQLGNTIKAHLEKREGARKTRHEAFTKLKDLVEQKANDATLKAQMKAVLDSHGKEQSMDDFAVELGKFLTPTEQAKVMVAFPEVMKDAMGLIREARQGRGGRGGGMGRRGPGMGGPPGDDDVDL